MLASKALLICMVILFNYKFFNFTEGLNVYTQVVHHILKDASKTAEWKPGVETSSFKASERSTPRRSSSWMDTNVGVDQVIEIITDAVFHENNDVELYEQVLIRYWS